MSSHPRSRFPRRQAFTLLEIVLALALAVFLLAALYASLTVLLGLSQSGRERVQQGVTARSVFERITVDILGQLPFQKAATSTGQTTGTQSDPSQTTAGQTTGGQTTSGQTTDGQTTDPEMDPPTAEPSDSNMSPPFNVGVWGQPQSIRLALSRWPRELFPNEGDAPTGVSDLRRVDYWLATDGGKVLGLARREVIRVTAQDENVDPTTLSDQASYVIADDVRDLSFRYWSGPSSSETWDGRQSGPPSAVEIFLKLRVRPARGDQPEETRTYRHVIAIPGANIGQQGSGGP